MFIEIRDELVNMDLVEFINIEMHWESPWVTLHTVNGPNYFRCSDDKEAKELYKEICDKLNLPVYYPTFDPKEKIWYSTGSCFKKL